MKDEQSETRKCWDLEWRIERVIENWVWPLAIGRLVVK